MNFNNQQSHLKIICQRRHLFKDVTYYLDVLDSHLIICQKPNQENPKYILELGLSNIIHLHPMDNTFTISFQDRDKTFHCREDDLKKLRLSLQGLVMFKEVADYYLPIKLLGKGGDSKVYQVIDKFTKINYASKCVQKKHIQDRESLFNEIKIMASLRSEQIVKLVEVFEGDNTFYLILEHLTGHSLHDVCQRNSVGQLSWDQIRKILWQILTGVAYMHSQNIMHRDLKPENIMFKQNLQELRIIDFGLASFTNTPQLLFPKCGTPGYVAPEIANLKDLNKKYDEVCDIFSVGCIFYKMITFKDLFPGTDHHEVLKINKKCLYNLDCLSIFKTPKSALDLIKHMLQQDPNKRITAADALQHEFFLENPTQDKKLLFQNQKKKESANKLWQTQVFVCEDTIPEEQPVIQLPAHNSAKLYARKQNLESPLQDKRAGFKKAITTEFNNSQTSSPQVSQPSFFMGGAVVLVDSIQEENDDENLIQL